MERNKLHCIHARSALEWIWALLSIILTVSCRIELHMCKLSDALVSVDSDMVQCE